jgi:hypothetical protein
MRRLESDGKRNANMVTEKEGSYPIRAVVDDLARKKLRALIERIRPEVEVVVTESTARAMRK